jgi:hypothetical protein
MINPLRRGWGAPLEMLLRVWVLDDSFSLE